MFNKIRQLTYGVRVLLSKTGGVREEIDLAGHKIELFQKGNGPPLVYLHSTLGESFMWFPFYQSLSQQFHVYVPTHPGFGSSSGFEDIDTIEDMAFHYVELFDALGLEKVILGGISLGGWIAAEFAARWPERVSKLWIADAPGLWVDQEPLPDLFRYLTDSNKLRQLLFADPEGPMARLVIPDQADEESMMKAFQSMTVLARLVWERPYNPKLAKRLRRIQCPVLLLWGDQDRLVPRAYGEAYMAHLPQAKMVVLPHCGHLPMFEKEGDFVRELTAFGRA